MNNEVRNRLIAGGILLVLSGALGLTGCAGGTAVSGTEGAKETPASPTSDMDALVEAAEAEGSLTWYTGTPPATIEKVVEAFQAEYNISVNATRLPSADIAQRFQAEIAAEDVQADVLGTVDQGFFTEMYDEGHLKKLTDFERGSVTDDQFLLGDFGVVATVGVSAIGYNTDVLGDFAPENWEDLLDDRLDGQVILVDPRGSQAWAQMWTVVLDDPDLGADFIKKFGALGHQVVNSGTPGAELLNAGEGGLLAANIPGTFEAAKDLGAPVDYFVPQDPFYGVFTWAVITDAAPHPSAASLFVHWLASEEGSQVYNEADQGISPLGDLEGTWPTPEGGIENPPSPAHLQESLPEILSLLQLQ